MRKVAQIMGMPIVVEIIDCSDGSVFDEAFNELKRIDQKFSSYKPDSQISKFNAGIIGINNLDDEVKGIILSCEKVKKDTNGYFDVWRGNKLDLDGYVKGWAIQKAADKLSNLTEKDFCVSAGGDILVKGQRGWNIGIQKPESKLEIVAKTKIKNSSIATSGNYEKGDHIINPLGQGIPGEFVSVSVCGPDIVDCDILATTIFAAENINQKIIKRFGKYYVMAIGKNGIFFSDGAKEKFSLVEN